MCTLGAKREVDHVWAVVCIYTSCDVNLFLYRDEKQAVAKYQQVRTRRLATGETIMEEDYLGLAGDTDHSFTTAQGFTAILRETGVR